MTFYIGRYGKLGFDSPPTTMQLSRILKPIKTMEEQKTIEMLREIVEQQNKALVSVRVYIEDMHELQKLQKEYSEVLEEQVKYYQLLKLSLWN